MHAAGELTGKIPVVTQVTLQVHRMESVVPRPGKVEIGFMDDRLTGTGGAAFVAEVARRLGLLPRLAAAVSVKKRARGASDA